MVFLIMSVSPSGRRVGKIAEDLQDEVPGLSGQFACHGGLLFSVVDETGSRLPVLCKA
jgi:hypothetical protein